jgi:mono/diheme cytochrome c family protein
VTATIRALVFLLAAAAAVAGIVVYSIARRGLSVHDEPSAVEALVARTVRGWATPSEVRSRTNPVAPTPTVLRQAREHWADHCATCHANDGSGDTAIGRGLYPRAPDMRAAETQELTDGELFWIIEHGIRLTGMPGWRDGTPEGERESWGLVHFVRHLPELTAAEVEEMEALNPRSADEWRQEEEARRFLAGEDVNGSDAAAPEP